VKTGVYSAVSLIVSNLAILFCCVPFLFLVSKKMRSVRTYRVIGIYWLLNGLINLYNLDLFPFFKNSAFQDKLVSWYNLLDTPMVLLIFAAAVTGAQRRVILISMMFFLGSELTLVAWKGYNFISGTAVIGTGLLLILTFTIIGLVQYMKRMEHTAFENSMAFVYAALLFAYGSFLIVYIFHIRGSSGINSQDTFLLYYISLLLSAATTTLGLWSYGLRRQPR
jgi:hypothetical protein